MTDNTASPYTVPLDWADVQIGMEVELNHEKYPSVVGEVEQISDGWIVVLTTGATYRCDPGAWSLWVKPEPVKRDPLIATIWAMYGMNHTTSMELTEVIRAAGYMTEAEWETKRPRRELPLLDSDDVSSWPEEFISQANQWQMFYRDFANTYNAYTLAARAYLASTPEKSKP